MKLIGRPLAGDMLYNAHVAAIEDCTEVRAAIAYAQDKKLLFEDCVKAGKKLTFYGRLDGTCPVDLRILSWFLEAKSPNAVCRLVPHWLHAKVIWWVGAGAYIGSANLTDRAWYKNYEAGLYLTHEEIEQFGLILELERFFDGMERNSIPLNQEEFDRLSKLDKDRAALLKKLDELSESFENEHWKLKDKTSPISINAQKSEDRKLVAFQKEWASTLQLIRDIGTRVALDENRPSWISPDVPQGVQGDQFLHAYYYQVVQPMSEKNAYLRDHERNKNDPEAALRRALQWWKSGEYGHIQEERTIYRSAPSLRALLSRDRISSLGEAEWVEALTLVYAFGDHASKIENALLGLGEDPGAEAKSDALAHMIWRQSTRTGMPAPEVFKYVIWGSGDVSERIWAASHEPAYRLRHIGTNIYGEIVGWARPTEYPPRNSRTSKSLCALGYPVSVLA